MTNDKLKEYIKTFPVLLFDMGDTFMFNCDRFSDGENYQPTYRSLGGKNLTQNKIAQSIMHIFNALLMIGRDEARYQSFPTLGEFISSDAYFQDFDIHDVAIVHRVGRLKVGDRLLLIAVSTSHRQSAFAACMSIVDEIKVIHSAWAKEYYSSS